MKDLGTIKLETDRLILRRFDIDDADAMYENWASAPIVTKYLSWEYHKDVEETKTIIKSWIRDYEKGSYNWAVELKETKEIIGNISAIAIHKNDLNAEIGYCYGAKYWGKGYASEALRKVIEFFINDCGLYLIEADHVVSNHASGKVMEKAGMHKEAVLRGRKINKETKEFDDIVVYSITRNELNKG